MSLTVISMSHDGRADQNSRGGSGSGSSRNASTKNFAYKSAQDEIATAPHMNSADDNSIIGALEVTLAYRYQFRARSIKPGGTNCESINMYMVGVCVHANPADGQPTQFACDFKFCWGLTSPRQFRTSECGADRNYARGWQRKERNTFHIIVVKSWLLCILASLPTSRSALHDVQIEQWSINQRALTTYTSFLHTGCIFELGIGMPLSSVVYPLLLNLTSISCSPALLINHGWRTAAIQWDLSNGPAFTFHGTGRKTSKLENLGVFIKIRFSTIYSPYPATKSVWKPFSQHLLKSKPEL